MSYLVLLGYLSAIITSIFGHFLIKIMYGLEYIEATSILFVYMWSGVFINMSVLRGQYFVISEHTVYSLLCNFLGAITNIFLNSLLIPRIGSIGAAIATFISYGVYAFISSFLFRELIPIGKVEMRALLLKGIPWKQITINTIFRLNKRRD